MVRRSSDTAATATPSRYRLKPFRYQTSRTTLVCVGLPAPVLAKPGPLPTGGWAFEPKWHVFRAIIRSGDHYCVRSRRGWQMTQLRPELASLPVEAVFDGELVAFGDDGLPSFERDLSVIFGARVTGDDGASDHVVLERSLDLVHASTRAEKRQLELFVLSVGKGLTGLIDRGVQLAG
jgi:ATP-dependent DNA ligase